MKTVGVALLLLFLQACVINTAPPPNNNSGGGGYASNPGYAPYAPGTRVSILWKGSWYSGVVVRTSGNKSLVHYDGYDSSWDEWVAPGRLRAGGGGGGGTYSPPPPAPAAYRAPGSHVQVYWKGSWYNAVILKVSGNSYYIHYDGYSSSWNEWVGPSRVR